RVRYCRSRDVEHLPCRHVLPCGQNRGVFRGTRQTSSTQVTDDIASVKRARQATFRLDRAAQTCVKLRGPRTHVRTKGEADEKNSRMVHLPGIGPAQQHVA